MNVSLKIVLIFWLVGAMGAVTAQDSPEGLGSGTEAPEGSGTGTEAPEGSGSVPTDAPVTTPGPCASSPCIKDSICEERPEGTFVCICRPGLVYTDTSGCTTGKVFPSRLKFSLDFEPEMADKTSDKFKNTARKIENQLNDSLQGNGYIRSVVLSLSKGSIDAEVQNFYELTSTATLETIKENIQKAADAGTIDDYSGFEQISLCDYEICDSTTTTCGDEGSGVANCTCLEGYIISQSTSQICLACPNGERAVGSDKCEKCPFGFSGFNCNDPYLLVVVVVSTVLGAFLIIITVALIVVSCRNQKESSSPKVDFSSNYGNSELHKPTGVPRIPRANPDANWKSNSLEMTNSVSNQALVTRDRPESKTRYSDYEDVSYRSQVPPAYSGYSGRGVGNGGVQNPYFRQDEDRMRRY